jgi:hypothetical protein
VIVVLTNAVDGPAFILLSGIVRILNKIKKDEKKFLVKEQKGKPDFSSIIGFYANDWTTSLYSQIGSKLVGIAPGLDNPLDYFIIFKHDQGYKFINPKEFPAYAPGQSFEFIDDPEGEKIVMDNHQGKKFPFKFNY